MPGRSLFVRDDLSHTAPGRPGRKRPPGIARYSGRGDALEKSRSRTNKLMKTGIIEHHQSLRQRAGNVPLRLGDRARNFKFRANRLLETGIIVRSQELGRSLSAGRLSRSATEHTPGF